MPNRQEIFKNPQDGPAISSFNAETQTISAGQVLLIENETTPDSVTLIIHNETGVGQKDGDTYTRKVTKDEIKYLPIIDQDQIIKLQEESNKGAYSYDLFKYDVLGHTLISETTTEDLGFGNGYETSHTLYLLKEEEKKNTPDMTPFIDCKNVFDGTSLEIKDLFVDVDKDKVIFSVQDRRVLGEPDPIAVHLVQKAEDIAQLSPITVDKIKELKGDMERQFNFYLFQACGETIVWMRQTDREGYYQGFDIYNYEYRLEKPSAPQSVSERVNLQ